MTDVELDRGIPYVLTDEDRRVVAGTTSGLNDSDGHLRAIHDAQIGRSVARRARLLAELGQTERSILLRRCAVEALSANSETP